MTWGGIHLLQAGEPGQMETATVNCMYNSNHLLLAVGSVIVDFSKCLVIFG